MTTWHATHEFSTNQPGDTPTHGQVCLPTMRRRGWLPSAMAMTRQGGGQTQRAMITEHQNDGRASTNAMWLHYTSEQKQRFACECRGLCGIHRMGWLLICGAVGCGFGKILSVRASVGAVVGAVVGAIAVCVGAVGVTYLEFLNHTQLKEPLPLLRKIH